MDWNITQDTITAIDFRQNPQKMKTQKDTEKIAKKEAKLVLRVQTEMKMNTIDPFAPILIFGILCNFKVEYQNNGTYERAERWVILYSMT